ncbi:MAG: alpha/beta fold hydrolase [Syntrophales bacterium]|nr:alpha/beta fold hydrolase [Syntrophales bacterium]
MSENRLPFDISAHRNLYPFKLNWFSVGKHRIHYVDEGEGEPLIMLHGNPTWSFFFRALIVRFSPGYRVIAPDHMGCGLSSRPSENDFVYTLEGHVANLGALIEYLNLDTRITLVLHDWGGMIGMAWACMQPERIGRIVVLNTGAFLIPPGKKLPWQLGFVKYFPLVPALLIRGLNAFAYLATYMGVEGSMTREVRRALIAPYNSWHNRIAILRFVQDIPVTEKDRSYRLARWTDEHLQLFRDVPMLICWGGKDFVFDDAILAEWRRRFPRAEVHVFPDAGHYILEDKPHEVGNLIEDFLNRFPL